MKRVPCLLILLLASLGIHAQPRMLFPVFPTPLAFRCFGDSGIVALYSGGVALGADFGKVRYPTSVLRYSSNAGKTWYRSVSVPHPFSTTNFPTAVEILDSITIVGQTIRQVDAPSKVQGALVRSSNGGQSWTEVLSTSALGSLTFATDKLGAYCDGDSVFWTTTDGGLTWRACTVPRINPDEPNDIAGVLPLSADRWLILTNSHESWIGRVQYRFRATVDRIEEAPSRFRSSNQASFWISDILAFTRSRDSVLITTCLTVEDRRYPDLDEVSLQVQSSTNLGKEWTNWFFSSRGSGKYFRNQAWRNLNRVSPVWFNEDIGIMAMDAIHRTTDGGRTWFSFNVMGACLASCSPTGFGVVKGCIPFGNNPTELDSMKYVTYVTHDFGATWSTKVDYQGSYYYDEKSEITRDLHRDYIVIRKDNALFQSGDQGISWSESRIVLPPVPNAFTITDAWHPMLVVGEKGRYHLGCYGYSDDAGQSWTRPRVAPLNMRSAATCVRGKGGRLVHALESHGIIYWALSTDQGETWEIQDSLRLPGVNADVFDRMAVSPVDSTIQCLVVEKDTARQWYTVWSRYPYTNWESRPIQPPPPVYDNTLNRLFVARSVALNGRGIMFLDRYQDSLVMSMDFGETWSAVRIPRSSEDGILQVRGQQLRLLALMDGSFLYRDGSALRLSRDGGMSWPVVSSEVLGVGGNSLIQNPNGDIWMIGSSSPNYFADAVYSLIPPDLLLSTSAPLALSTSTFTLPPAWPNPASSQGAVHLPYELSSPAEVTIVIRDILGRVVARLDQGRRDVGRHEALWQPRGLGPGVYLTQVSVGSGRVAMGKVVVR